MEEVAVAYAHQSGVGRIRDDDQNGKSLVAFQDLAPVRPYGSGVVAPTLTTRRRSWTLGM